MSLRADDGTPLETKEGIVLNSEGQPVTDFRPRVRSFSLSLPLPAIVGVVLFLPVALTIGITFFIALILSLTVFAIMRTVLRFLKNP